MPKRKPKPAPDLLSVLTDARRVLLIARGFYQVPDPHGGPPRWRALDGAVLDEAEAFLRLGNEEGHNDG